MGVHGIDTGCVWGGKLTALELGPEPRVIQVPGKTGSARGD
jgi:bis(5'-nucleosyl)-tetraphosphatase (symmetrical)